MIDASPGEDVTDSQPEIVVQIGDQSVALPPPTLTGDMDADEQQQHITSQLRGLSYRQFARDSIVAPVRINLSYIKDESGNRLGHNVHVLFIVHESLETFSQQNIADRLGGESDPDSAGESGEVPAETLEKLGIQDAGPNVRYRKLSFDLLDKVRLNGLLRIAQTTSETLNRIDLSLVETDENRWQAIDDRDLQGPYSGFQGWLTATSLRGQDAVLIEARFAMEEPADWFAGDNYLRSKLPIVLQEAARDLRRRLKKAD